MRPEFSPPENSWCEAIRKQRAADIEQRLYREYVLGNRPAVRLSRWVMEQVGAAWRAVTSARPKTEPVIPLLTSQREQTVR